MKIGKRHHIKVKKSKQLFETISTALKLEIGNLSPKKMRVEVVELPVEGELILIDNNPFFIQISEQVFPTLVNNDFLVKLPKITVDMGAIPYVCNGADLMAPGIVRVNGIFEKGDIIVIIEEKYFKPIAIAKTLYNSFDVSTKQHGKIAENLHYIGDSFWKAINEL